MANETQFLFTRDGNTAFLVEPLAHDDVHGCNNRGPAMARLLVPPLIALISSQVFAMDSLSELTWKKRAVIVFGDVRDQRVAQQIKILTDQRSELSERDLVVLGVSDDDAKAFFGSVSKLDAVALRREADIKKDRFQVILVGKDGGIKLRSDTVVSNLDMFDVIDRMPMRRAERE
ncbi:DUF4174 domain-containing protein [Agrobacterium rosae]|nr:DUF4174 domain-containing protein [Agrobacterium rosae]KAA3513483.1 DUF4174 domain-containing protein [Agrobacterium rosae]